MTSLPRLLGWSLVAAALALAPTPAWSGSPKKAMTAQQRAEAKRLFDQAHLAYERGRYEEAILKWEQSYELSGEPLIFESIANAYERLGDTRQAREYLARWRAAAPRSEQAALDERLASLDARIGKEDEQQRLEAERRKKAESEAASLDEERARVEQERARLRGEHELAEDRDAERAQIAIAGWALTGLGGAAVLAGVIVDVIAATSRPDEATACAQASDGQICRASARDDIDASNALAVGGDVTWIAGGAVAATGIALLVAAFVMEGEATAGGPEAARLVPWLAPGAGGLGLRGSF